MTNQLTTYYIPQNPNIQTGTIYTLYLNNNTNLDLTSILQKQELYSNEIATPFKENKIIIEQIYYNELIQMLNQTSILLTNITNNIKSYREEENKNLTELINLNQKCQETVKNFLLERKI